MSFIPKEIVQLGAGCQCTRVLCIVPFRSSLDEGPDLLLGDAVLYLELSRFREDIEDSWL